MSADLERALDAVGRTIAVALLADEAVQREVVERAVALVLPEADRLGDTTTAWLCHQTYLACFSAIDGGARSAADPTWLDALRATPAGVRVAGGLAALAGYDPETVSRLVSRPAEETDTLIGRFPRPPAPAPVAPTPVEPVRGAEAEATAAPSTPAPTTPPAPPPMADVVPTATTVGPGGPSPDHRRRTRRRMGVVGIVVVCLALAVIGAVALSGRADEPDPTAGDTGLGPSSTTVAVDASDGCGVDPEARPRGVQTIEVPHRGLDRSYRLAAPDVTPEEPDVPLGGLLVDLTDVDVEVDDHVATTGVDELAVNDGWTVVSPAPLAGSAPQWNVAGDLEDPDDIGFVSASITDVAARSCIDTARIVVVGLGAGAHLAAEVVCAEPGRYAGLVMVAGASRPDDCPPTVTSVSAVLLTDDTVFPLDGGRGETFPDLASLRPGSLYEPPDPRLAISQWATGSDCDTGVQDGDDDLAPIEYGGCTGGVSVVAVTVEGPHGWAPAATQLVDEMMADAVLPARSADSE